MVTCSVLPSPTVESWFSDVQCDVDWRRILYELILSLLYVLYPLLLYIPTRLLIDVCRGPRSTADLNDVLGRLGRHVPRPSLVLCPACYAGNHMWMVRTYSLSPSSVPAVRIIKLTKPLL